MGPPDVAYPDGMLGRWDVKRLLADVDFPQGQSDAEGVLAEQMLSHKGKVDSFTTRFIPGKNGVVSDRDFNMRSLTSVSEGANVDVQWKATNPNVLTVSYPTGTLRETKVSSPPPARTLLIQPISAPSVQSPLHPTAKAGIRRIPVSRLTHINHRDFEPPYILSHTRSQSGQRHSTQRRRLLNGANIRASQT